MTQDDIRDHLGGNASVLVQVSGPGDGSAEIAWGDTFFFVYDKNGDPRKMPFATIVTKDYEGFDSDSDLNRDGVFRLNIDVGKERFKELFGFATKDMESHRNGFDFSVPDQIFPHPVYGPNGWVSVINPGPRSSDETRSLMDLALARAVSRIET